MKTERNSFKAAKNNQNFIYFCFHKADALQNFCPVYFCSNLKVIETGKNLFVTRNVRNNDESAGLYSFHVSTCCSKGEVISIVS